MHVSKPEKSQPENMQKMHPENIHILFTFFNINTILCGIQLCTAHLIGTTFCKQNKKHSKIKAFIGALDSYKARFL